MLCQPLYVDEQRTKDVIYVLQDKEIELILKFIIYNFYFTFKYHISRVQLYTYIPQVELNEKPNQNDK